MPQTANSIPTGELFADLQVSLTEIVLIELLSNPININKYDSRKRGNNDIVKSIKQIMRRRFTEKDIEDFLENGFPRTVDLQRTIP